MGGDYGFAWNPHGDYAKELTFFVQSVGFTPLETLTCATRTVLNPAASLRIWAGNPARFIRLAQPRTPIGAVG